MADPIASSALSLVVDDAEHIISMNVVRVADAAQLVVKLSLAIRKPSGQVMERLEGSFNLTDAAVAGTVDPLDVAALRRVLVALGQKLASDAGMTVTVPAA